MDRSTIVPALIGLAGVVVGAYLTARHQRAERRQGVIREQLDRFYSPLLSRREQLRAKGDLRLKVSVAARAAWNEPGADNRLQEYEKIIEYNNRQLAKDQLLYREMVDLFAAKMWLAEPSTRQHFGTLVEFVEIWNRLLDESLPGEVRLKLERETNEEKLYPLYEEVRTQLDRLRQELKESVGVWARSSRWVSRK